MRIGQRLKSESIGSGNYGTREINSVVLKFEHYSMDICLSIKIKRICLCNISAMLVFIGMYLRSVAC